MPNPTSMTGGCLCSKIRYTVDFTADHDWKRGPRDCQCTQCRKFSGSLVLEFHAVGSSEFKWDSQSTLRIYKASPLAKRFFCGECGSSVAWQEEAAGGGISVCIGSIDERYLVGDKARDKEGQGKGGYGLELAGAERSHYYCQNAIKGVTDELKGDMNLRGDNSGTLN